MVCSVTVKAGKDHELHAVGFLTHSGVSFVDVSEAFKGLDEDARDYFQTSFDYFLDDVTLTKYPHRYHGWKKSVAKGRFRYCFVFKYPPHRLYGFLCHPKESLTPSDRRFLGCVLVLHAEKLKWLTDQEELKRVNKMRENAEVLKAIKWPWKEEKKR
jgi:hypothetical protein